MTAQTRLLALVALAPLAGLAMQAGAGKAPAPKGDLIIEDCFGGELDRFVMGTDNESYFGGDAESDGKVITQEFLQQVPVGRSYQQSIQTAAGVGKKAKEERSARDTAAAAPAKDRRSPGPKKSSPKADKAPMAPPPPPAQAAPPVEIGGLLGGGALDDATAVAEPMPEPEVVYEEELADADRGYFEDQKPKTVAKRVMDWGAKIYLSNDDSMSLASAQRILYSVMNGVNFQPSEVRPHELLNYFSFDTVTPDADQVFDVLASAEQDGDTLAVAFAVQGATPVHQPLDLTMVIDRSGSMRAEGRMEYTKRALSTMSERLHDGDRLDIVMFDNAVCSPLQNFVVGRDDPALLNKVISLMAPMGGTNLDIGLQEGYKIAQSHEDTRGRNRRMMLVTDANMNQGDVNVNTVTEIGKAFEDSGIRLTGVGVGRDFRDDVLDKLTEKGKGAYVYLGSEAVVDRLFGVGFDSLTSTIAHDVSFSVDLPDSLAMERFYGEEASTSKEDVQPINYYAGTSQLFLQDLSMKNGKAVRNDPITLTVEYRDPKTGEPETRKFRTTVGKMLDADRHNVRKGRALMAWSDMLATQSMGASPCGEELDTYARRASLLGEDAEIGFVNSLVKKRCGEFKLPSVVASTKGVMYKVRVDSDIPVSQVQLSCAGNEWSEALSGSDTIAKFSATPGECTVTLRGTVDMSARVEVPATGGDLRCMVRGGRLNCS